MKKFLLFLSLLLVVISTSGCIKYEYTIDIDKKNNIAFSQVSAFNTKTIEELSKEATVKGCSYDELKESVEKEGFIASVYNKDGYKGVKADKKYNMKSFKLPNGFKSNTETPFEMKSSMGGAKKTYSINWQYDIKDTEKSDDNAMAEQEINRYNNDNLWSGVKYNNDNDEIVSKDISTDEETGITTEKTVYKSGAVATCSYNKKEMEQTSQQMSDMMTSMFYSNPKFRPHADLIIKIPAKKADKHNANEVINKNEYHWNLVDLSKEEPISIELEYSMYDFSLFGIFGTLILLLFGLAFAWKKINE